MGLLHAAATLETPEQNAVNVLYCSVPELRMLYLLSPSLTAKESP